MNAGMVGADPQVLREMASRFDASAQELMGVKGSVQIWVDMTNIWLGLNYHLFKDMWETTGARTIVDAASIFHRCADVLRANADAQDETSAAGGGSGGPGSHSGLFGGGGGGGGGSTDNSDGTRPRLDLTEPRAVHSYIRDSLQTVEVGARAIAWINHQQFAGAAAEGNLPAMAMHFMHQADALQFAEYVKGAGDALGYVGDAIDVIGAIDELSSGNPSEMTMGAVHLVTTGLGKLGPVGAIGAGVISAYESIMPTTAEKQDELLAYSANKMFPGVAMSDLSSEQMAQVTNRYTGVVGFGNMVVDGASNSVEKAAHGAGAVVENVSRSVGGAIDGAKSFFGWN